MNVVVDGDHSRRVYIDSGFPQGEMLGPVVYLCHINDLPLIVKVQVRLFADDCLLYRTIYTIHDHIDLQNGLYYLDIWPET
jgi:hypothetical protein